MEKEPSSSELDLVNQASRGDLRAFGSLVANYQRAVFNIALYKSRNYFDAEDLTQDIFFAAFKALSTIKAPENFGSWLFGIAYNRCHKWYRRERTKILKIQEIRDRAEREDRSRHRPSALSAHQVPGSSGSGASGQSNPHLAETMRRLPKDVRETLTLKYLEGLSYQEIEVRLGINAHRIDYLIRKGKQMIRERMGLNSAGGAT